MYVFQAKGLQHCRNIKLDAMEIYRSAPYLDLYDRGWNRNRWHECLKMAMEDHRALVEEELRAREEET